MHDLLCSLQFFLLPHLSTVWAGGSVSSGAAHYDDNSQLFNSELGKELLKLQSNQNESLDPLIVKDILVSTEDIRIATRLSELTSEITNQIELEDQSIHIKSMFILYYNLYCNLNFV